jgi:hypothetical protein
MTATRFLVGIAALLCCATASGQEPPRDPIAAEALFERGKTLMDQGRRAEACAAFAESERLDPAGGTLLRLALCHEADGKLASAWLEYLEVVRVSREGTGEPAKLAERVRIAREHLAQIEPRVPKLAIVVPPAARVDGLRVSANGLPRDEGAWGIALPVDPGDVVVVATAPGRSEYRTTVRVVEGQQQTVDVAPLAPTATPAIAPPAPARPLPPRHASLLRPLGIGVGAVGVAALGVGTYFGARAISKWNASNAVCPGTTCPDASGVSLAGDAKDSAHVADATLAAGAAMVVAGIVLFVIGGADGAPLRGGSRGITLTF